MGSIVLEPSSRTLLSELLTPPSGFALSHAVGTTFTLSLEAALAVPLSFARLGLTSSPEDTVGVLGAVRQAVDRVDVFAQSGYISLGNASDLVSVLEPMIHPITMRRGLFHPKVWFLEFESGDERRYRFICSSRNLTTDRTWDAVVRLDGEATTDVLPDNNAMVQMLRWLAEGNRTTPQLPAQRSARIEQLAQAWRRIRWEYPENVKRLSVHVLGVGADSAPRLNGQRALIVSPFVTDDGLRRLRAGKGGETMVVSRPEQLDRLTPDAVRAHETYVLDDFVDQALSDSELPDRSQPDALSGLHAKVIVHDRAIGGSVMLIGSTNATTPAWTTNVEAIVEVEGPTSQLGVDVITSSLAPLLTAYATDGGAEVDDDEVAAQNLDHALRDIAQEPINIRVLQGNGHSIEVWADRPTDVPAGFSMEWRLVTKRGFVTGGFPAAASPQVFDIELQQISPFIIVKLSDGQGRSKQSLIVASILDDVPDRIDAIVASHLTEPGAMVRFIRMMLWTSEFGAGASGGPLPLFQANFGGGVREDGSGLLELLVRAVATNPSALAEIERVLHHLSPMERAQALPDGFTQVWDAVMAGIGKARRP